MSSTLPMLDDSSPTPSNNQATLATIAGFLGWTLDAFDFFAVTLCVSQIAKTFGVDNAVVFISLTLTLAMRPVGAFIFGLLSDRFGRRGPMMLNLVFYSTIQVATAFSPNITVFLILRCLFGIGMGGEWGVGASLVMEKVPRKWRGLLSGVLQEGYAVGNLLAALTAYLVLQRFGWRWMFIIGGVPALLAVFIRFFVHESDIWTKHKSESWSQFGNVLKSNWKLWIFLTILMAMMNFASHGTQDHYPQFMQSFRHLTIPSYTKMVMISMIGAIFGGLVFGVLSDRFGRRAMMILAFIGAIALIPLWAFSTTWASIAAGAFCMQFMIQGAWGIIPAHLSELSPNKVRGFLPGFSYQCGNLIASSIEIIQSGLIKHHAYPNVMALTALIIFVLAITVISFSPERRAREFDAPD